MKCPLKQAGGKNWSTWKPLTSRSRPGGNGADDEGTGSHFESGCRQAEVVGSSRDYGRDRPHDAALARTVAGARLQRIVGLPQEEAEPETSADGDGGASAAAVPGEVLRLQRAALSREAGRSTRH